MCTNFTYTYRGLNVLNVKALLALLTRRSLLHDCDTFMNLRLTFVSCSNILCSIFWCRLSGVTQAGDDHCPPLLWVVCTPGPGEVRGGASYSDGTQTEHF